MNKKAKLSKKDVINLAKLANLQLSDKESDKYEKQLTETLIYVENLNKIDTSKVLPADHVVKLKNATFKDGEKNQRGLTQEQALANSKKKKKSYFVVPRIL